ncbi:endonuclease/exonuclease/phosphatase family protein [Nocardioides dongkuii]|uniref:endonuclease/exonuclease/phosphatase family protein n=1 Tax=Nocardioides dongkuii TaxID=2760089 RepID=UPI0015FCC8F2|nr:endonuclease/exonuclease/phosphatase family protein [Nocardioides dongkuii]
MRSDRRARAASYRMALGAALVAALVVGGATPAVVAASARQADTTYRPVTVVQANISKDLSKAKFQADVATVFATQPDLITFNEVHGRDDALLAPPGYAMFRTPGPRTGWAPVVWRTDTWTAVNQGTTKISDRPKKFRNKPGMVGVRYANWVTLAAADGQRVSLISAHIAPNNKDTAELLVPSLRRLRDLALELGTSGPVILGGDFNMGYRSDRYQPRFLAAAGLASTFDMTGSSFVTHRRGGTIDYVFLGPDGRFLVDEQYPVVLNSDHRMVVARLQMLSEPSEPSAEPPPAFEAGTVVSDSRGTAAERFAIRSLQLRAIEATPPGQAIHVASEKIRGGALLRALAAAKERGAEVTVITGRRDLSTQEKELRTLLGRNSGASSYFVKSGRAWPSSAKEARRRPRAFLKPTVLLISQAGATPAFTLVADSDLGRSSLRPKQRTVSRATVTTSMRRYDRSYRKYLKVLGRTY